MKKAALSLFAAALLFPSNADAQARTWTTRDTSCFLFCITTVRVWSDDGSGTVSGIRLVSSRTFFSWERPD
ncbi:hypothetical protein L1280_000699 [Deinococcus sp. HSC-46F16]|uniref:hypothetical protein n=1 Tax=Deinococcus sp. HSC-46F16 TaxID=2910968 RepID=UPI00209E8657|nr:hypothetical protein [Deinococcus sp. HSC-46F16]MCP2013571.1 hypothetical protein [Deinococcus sp. HSC-46F16]